MNNMLVKRILPVSLLMILLLDSAYAQRKRSQYPDFISDAFFSVNIGYINYPFSELQLELPYETVESVVVPHTAVRLMLYGRSLTDWLEVQVSYMRPVLWVEYNNLNNQPSKNTVWMNVGGLTLLPKVPLTPELTLFGEFGLAVVTRSGFEHQGFVAVKDANYGHFLFGAGLNYHLNDKFDLMLSSAYAPEVDKYNQPSTFFISPGFRYNMRPLSEEKVEANANSGYIFPKNQISLGYTSNIAGYGTNLFFSNLSVFWGGHLEVQNGISLNYQRNVFHGRKFFALDVGANVSRWKTNQFETVFHTLSLYPVLRFTLLRTSPADFFFFYSVAGPTFITDGVIDEVETGRKFTFYDYMGIGTFAGDQRELSAELKIGHYSNGNLFPQNAGVMVPLTLSLGYNF
ncbi:MAG: acyloxyacyl hydrolase [Bacteroidota bacterium]